MRPAGRNLRAGLVDAAGVPMDILREASGAIDLVELLAVAGSRLAVSDVGAAACALRCAMESAAMAVYINTKLMRNREYADAVNQEASALLSDGVKRCDTVYRQIDCELRGLPCGN